MAWQNIESAGISTTVSPCPNQVYQLNFKLKAINTNAVTCSFKYRFGTGQWSSDYNFPSDGDRSPGPFDVGPFNAGSEGALQPVEVQLQGRVTCGGVNRISLGFDDFELVPKA